MFQNFVSFTTETSQNGINFAFQMPEKGKALDIEVIKFPINPPPLFSASYIISLTITLFIIDQIYKNLINKSKIDIITK